MSINKDYLDTVFKTIEILKNENKINLKQYINKTKTLLEINKTYNHLQIEEDLYLSVISGFNRYFETDKTCNIVINSYGKPYVNLPSNKRNDKCYYYEVLVIDNDIVEPLTDKYSIDLFSFDANAVINELYNIAVNNFINKVKEEK